MYEWVFANNGLDGYMRILNQLVTSMKFYEGFRGAFGISKNDFYASIAPYILDTIRRTAP